jgi:glycosyltransferase involved in cell wall biosynthesis
MKIGFDAKRLYNNFTGLGNYSRTLVSNLVNFYPDEEYYLYTTNISSDESVKKFYEDKRLRTVRAETPFKSFWRSYSIKNSLKNDKIDIFHGLSGEIPFSLPGGRIKSVVTIHDLIFRIHPDTYKPADRLLYNHKFRYACRHADRIVAISVSTRNDIIKYYGTNPERIKVVYQACDPVFYSPPDPVQMKLVSETYKLPGDFLLFVGSVIPRKNLLTVIKALDFLPADLRIPVVIVGDGRAYKKEVKRFISDRKLENLVIWIENLHDSRQLKALYNLAQIFIYPSVYEGFGLPVAEALLSKVPVITSNLSSLPEAGGPDSFLVNPYDFEETANGIRTILTDKTLKEKMINLGLRYAGEKFSMGITTREMLSCYRELIG